MYRQLGIIKEKTYAENQRDINFVHSITKNKINVDTKPIRPSNLYHRGTNKGRPGQYVIKTSTEFPATMNTLVIYFQAILGDHNLTPLKKGLFHKKELKLVIWGGSDQYLPSYRLIGAFDDFSKIVRGAVLDSFKLDVKSNDFMICTADWIGKEEIKTYDINMKNHKLFEETDLGYMDVDIEIGEPRIKGIIKSLSIDIKNNIKSDLVQGIYYRNMQSKPPAGDRTISIQAESIMHPDMHDFIDKVEYGNENSYSPTRCDLYQTPIRLFIKECGGTDERKIELFFPQCDVVADYEASGKDAIMVKYEITPTVSSEINKIPEIDYIKNTEMIVNATNVSNEAKDLIQS